MNKLTDSQVAAVLYFQHPSVVALQPLRDRGLWLALHSKPPDSRPFKSVGESHAFRCNPLVNASVINFESTAPNPSEFNKDQRHYQLLVAWCRDCLGYVKYNPEGARRAVAAAAKAKAKEAELIRKHLESRKAAHDEAIKKQRENRKRPASHLVSNILDVLEDALEKEAADETSQKRLRAMAANLLKEK